ncbi:MAG TPA: site-specific integrase, partial [Pirellulales bacterium]|nr:site-specific integrase [Pirellulales bacterium]
MIRRNKKAEIDPPARKPEHPWASAFADYLRSECHLADNTVAAYRRDLRRFYDWLGERRIPKLDIRELADY